MLKCRGQLGGRRGSAPRAGLQREGREAMVTASCMLRRVPEGSGVLLPGRHWSWAWARLAEEGESLRQKV